MLKAGLVLCLLAVLTNGQAPGQLCSQPADVAFLLDDSRSIWPPHYTVMKDFVKNLVATFDIGPTKTRVAAASFSRGAREEFAFGSYDTLAEVNQALDTVYQSQGDKTETFLGLRFIVDTTFKDARPNVPHILIVITDGVSSDRAQTVAAANDVRADGIEVIVIGVGSMDKAQMMEIASDPVNEHFFEVDQFDRLTSIQSLVAQRACEAAVTDAPVTDMPSDMAQNLCKQNPAEIAFVLDKSTSIYINDFKKQLEFVRDVIELFDIACDKTRVAAVSFSTNASVEYHLDEYCDDKQGLIDRTLKIQYTGGNTETSAALKLMTDSVFTPAHLDRPGVPHVVIVITDGRSQNWKATQLQAQALKLTGAHVFAIGVGNDVDQQELTDIGSVPSDQYVFEVSGYDALPSIKNVLAFRACGGQN